MRNNRIDFFRGIAIILVVYGHFVGYNFGEDSPWLIVSPTAGVWIFFIVSGFLMYTKIQETKSKKRFIGKRLVRIIPLAYLFMFLNGNTEVKAYLFAIDFGLSSGLGHFWSLKRELIFYLLIPFIFWIQITFRNFSYLMEFYVLMSPIFIYLDFHTNYSFVEFGYYFNILFLGCLVSKYYNQLSKYLSALKKISNKLLISILSILSVLFWRFDLPLMAGMNFSIIIFSLIFVITLETLENIENKLIMMLKNIIVKIGRISFSIYIFQQIFTQQDLPISFDNFNNDSLNFIFNCFLNSLALLIISAISFFTLEIKFHQFLIKTLKLNG